MATLCLVWGILSFGGMLLGLLPNWAPLNVLNVPFSAIGLILGIAALNNPPYMRSAAVKGTVLCSLGVVAGLIRMYIPGAWDGWGH